jgi:hypothetical protein
MEEAIDASDIFQKKSKRKILNSQEIWLIHEYVFQNSIAT